jgi:short-subunit dehydrogenase
MRAQGSGHIIQVSSLSGLVSILYLGIYQAAKHGLEGYSEALATEVAAHGIKVTIVEPTPYDTDWVYSSKEVATTNPAYDTFVNGGINTSQRRRRLTTEASLNPYSTWWTTPSRRYDSSWEATVCP